MQSKKGAQRTPSGGQPAAGGLPLRALGAQNVSDIRSRLVGAGGIALQIKANAPPLARPKIEGAGDLNQLRHPRPRD